ncbi:MAG TPA: hypothetical protein PKL84_04620, partial [Candidatus Hydrogenedentes bacterium]|nr:hypothetical protein [Candidatus Hydrogenedentota bacterium]
DLREIEVFREMPPDRSAVEYFGEGLLAAMRERMLREKKWDVYPLSESSFEFRKRTVNAVEAIIFATHPSALPRPSASVTSSTATPATTTRMLPMII